MTTFFVPFTTPAGAEASYQALSKRAGCAVTPPLEERIYSMLFTHNGEVWRASVGERLYGRRHGQAIVGGRAVYLEYEASDTALVLAILPGSPYRIVTDGGAEAGKASRWSTSITVCRPVQAVCFDVDDGSSKERSRRAGFEQQVAA